MTEPGDGSAGYARLPEDLLAALLRNTPAITEQVVSLLVPALSQRNSLREAAKKHNLIRVAPAGDCGTVCAVDGGFAVERTVAVDMVMAVAVGVEGFSSTMYSWEENQYASFHRVLVHDLDNERLARAAMICHEMAVLADAGHEVRIYDGSHLTPVIQLNSGFSSHSDTVSLGSVQIATDVDLFSAFDSFITHPGIIAMPKYDSSRELATELGTSIGIDIPGDDKYLTTLILHAGEYTAPRRVHGAQWAQLHLTASVGSAASKTGLVDKLDGLLAPLKQGELFYTYWRPYESGPSYRIEMKPDLARDEAALTRVLSTLGQQITGPFVREPYPQYLADVMAKSVGLGLSAVQTAAHLRLNREHPELAEYLIHSYRTEGV